MSTLPPGITVQDGHLTPADGARGPALLPEPSAGTAVRSGSAVPDRSAGRPRIAARHRAVARPGQEAVALAIACPEQLSPAAAGHGTQPLPCKAER
ncbi:hypothetical protein [Streptomyces clavuligerus]|uniref:hypothetical protein n=1 Tax=Streptomyces clavuligerus TaxID=1901 RepID=UPI00020D92D3|nr:hypothetical protein [Streptomyces clavuligerus]WDN56020.1 hypothetical protein LL058_29490 [Streptomyces clavuligerus]